MRLYKNIIFVLAMFLSVGAYAQPQLTHPLLVEVTHPTSIAGSYPYGYQATGWGPTSINTITGQGVWAYDITPDSLVCDTVTMDLTGKIALIRRGVCNFSQKVYYAQQAGAVACVICNNNGGTDVINMSGGTFAAQVTIPAVMFSAQHCALLENAIATDSLSITFRKPFISTVIPHYQYETPVAQIRAVEDASIVLYNAGSTTATGVVATLVMTSPTGLVTTVTENRPDLAPNATDTVTFSPFTPNGDTGTYSLTMKSNLSVTDTFAGTFRVADTLYTIDDQMNYHVAYPSDANHAIDYRHDAGAVFLTGSNVGYATGAIFGLENPAAFLGQTFTIKLLKVIGTFTATSDWNNGSDPTFALVGIGSKVITAADTFAYLLHQVPLIDINTFADSITLDTSSQYVNVITFTGSAGLPTVPHYAYAGNYDYSYLNAVIWTNGQAYSGWTSHDNVVARLVVKGSMNVVGTTPTFIAPKSFDVFPNPVSDIVNVAVSLDKMANNLNVNLIDINGRVIATQQFSDVQQSNVQFDTIELPAGFYFIRIQTEEGVRVKEFVKK